MTSSDFGPPFDEGRAIGEQRPTGRRWPTDERRPSGQRRPTDERERRGRRTGELHEFAEHAREHREREGTSEPTDAPRFDTGTTIVAVAAADGVVMAADRRMSLGGRFTANKHVDKIEQVHPTAAMAISGAVGPAQGLLDALRAEVSLYESRRGKPMTTTALSKTAAHLVQGLPVTPLLGGVDADRGHVYELDGAGSVLADAYAAAGSGMQVAYGVLERRLKDRSPADPVEKSLSAAGDAAVDAVAAASERDTASGNGVTVAAITGGGVDIDAHETADGATAADGEVA